MSMKCSKCGQETADKKDKRGSIRTPRGWKLRRDELWCDACWSAAFVRRAVTFPVAGPIGELEWPRFRELLSGAWQQSTSVANWLVTELAKAETARKPGDAKLSKAPAPYLYPAARKRFPDMEPTALVAVMNGVTRKYNATRYETHWTCERSLSNFRYPYPYAIPAQNWHARWFSETERVPIISIRLGGERIELRLRGGSEFRPQLAAFTQIVNGDAVPCELSIRRQVVTNSDHQNGVAERGQPGGSAMVRYRVMAQIAAWLPRLANAVGGKEMIVTTTAQEFWLAVVEGATPWILNCDHVRRWQRAHRNALDRLSQDTKFEKRWPSANRRHMQDYREQLCKKYRDRINTFCGQAAAMLANYACRQKVGTVTYDDSCKTYLPEFDWSGLKVKLKNKLDGFGINLNEKSASDELDEKSPESLAEE